MATSPKPCISPPRQPVLRPTMPEAVRPFLDELATLLAAKWLAEKKPREGGKQ